MAMDLKSGGNNMVFKPAEKRIDDYFAHPSSVRLAMEETQLEKEISRQEQRSENAGDIILSWRAPEFEVYEKSTRWYIIAGILDLIMATYGLLFQSPLMAITFILIGIVGFIQLQRPPVIRTFAITTTGLLAGNELYPYENIKSFWIFYDPPHTKVISLHTNANFLPFVHFPIGSQDPVKVHTALSQYLEEIEQTPSLVDAIERFLHI